MPVKLTKLKGGKVRVSTPHGIKAKSTTPEKATAQRNLLNAVEHGWKPTGKKKKPSKMTFKEYKDLRKSGWKG
jgi:hypothetical protein